MGIIGKVVTFIPSIAIDHISEFESIRTLLRVFTFQWSSKTPLNGMFCEVTPQSHSKNFNSILKLKQKCHKLMNSIWALLFTKYVPFIMNHRQSTEIWRGLFKLKNEFPPRIHSWKKSTWKHSHMNDRALAHCYPVETNKIYGQQQFHHHYGAGNLYGLFLILCEFYWFQIFGFNIPGFF